MKVPVYINDLLVDEERKMTAPWETLFNQLFTEMQSNLSDEGLVAPSQTTVNIGVIQDAQNTDGNDIYPNGTILYDSTTNQLKVKISGVFRVIQVV
jgi:hypothetical protein